MSLDIITLLRQYEKMAYQPDESEHPFWEHTSEYAASSDDTEFIGEVAYVLVTLYKSEVPQ